MTIPVASAHQLKQNNKKTTSTPLYQPVTGVPPLIDSPEIAKARADKIANPGAYLAVDTERAEGIRFFGRAYLVQAKGEDTETALFDPIALPNLADYFPAKDTNPTWVLHAAQEDLPSLLALNLVPQRLFDTQLAGKILGIERISLGAMIADYLGIHLAKNHSHENWSRRPLKNSWLGYAALDVEYLIDLAKKLTLQLSKVGKLDWAKEEFSYLLESIQKSPRCVTDPQLVEPRSWQELKGAQCLSSPTSRAAAQALFARRRKIASELDIAEHRILSNQDLIALAQKMPGNRKQLSEFAFMEDPRQQRYGGVWLHLIYQARRQPSEKCPKGKAPTRLAEIKSFAYWARFFPNRAQLGLDFRQIVKEKASSKEIWPEILCSPATIRSICADFHPSIDWRYLPAWQEQRTWQKTILEEAITDLFTEYSQGVKQVESGENYQGFVYDSRFFTD